MVDKLSMKEGWSLILGRILAFECDQPEMKQVVQSHITNYCLLSQCKETGRQYKGKNVVCKRLQDLVALSVEVLCRWRENGETRIFLAHVQSQQQCFIWFKYCNASQGLKALHRLSWMKPCQDRTLHEIHICTTCTQSRMVHLFMQSTFAFI